MATTPTAPEPAGENTVNTFVVADGVTDVITFLIDVFDATETIEARAPDMYAADDTLIHAEVRIGSSTVMLFDRKHDWPFTPALTQVYVPDAEEVLRRATGRGATIVTEVCPFYGGYDIARFLDPWHNLWWLFSPASDVEASSTEWDESEWDAPAEPDAVYTTVVEAMRNLRDPRTD